MAVVIGSGLGGLAAAVRLQARGYKVTVLERRDQPGGRAAAFRRDGFVFDAGPTVITAPHLFEELWTLAGRRMADDVTLKPVSPFYRIRFSEGDWFDYSGDHEAMCAEVKRFSPEDVRGYERFIRLSERIFDVGFVKLGDQPFHRWTTMARIAPAMIRLQSYRSVHGLVAKYIRDPRLRQVFSFNPLLIGGNPFATTAIYALIAYFERKWGVHFPVGGTGALVRGLVSLIEGAGGEVRTGAEVEEITLEGRRATGVRLRGGESLAASVVVSNADSAWTYRRLLPASVRRRWTDRRVDGARFSMGLFVWYFGVRGTYPEISQHSILLGPRYRELLEDIFSRKVLADDFSLYLHRPTATDPGLAPPGCDTFYVLSPVPNLDANIDWAVQAEPYRRRIAEHLERTLLPGLQSRLVTSHVVTPQYFRDELLSVKGAGFGMQPIMTQSAWFRPHNVSEDVQGLYLVGAGTHPGAGVPGVLSSARVLDRVVPHV